MNLWDRFGFLPLLLAVAIGLVACEDPSEVGLSLNSNGTQIGVFLEEIDLGMTNVFLDSLRTNGDSRLLVGKYADPIFGTTRSSAVSQIIPSTFSFELMNDSLTSSGERMFDYEIDSVILQLRYNYFHGDNFTQEQTIRVRQINDTLFSGVSYFAHFPVPTNDTEQLYGEGTFQVDPTTDSLLRINLDGFGDKTLDYLRVASASTLSTDSIFNQLRGLAIIPDEGNNIMLGFDPVSTDSRLSVYYKILQVENVQQDSVYTDSLSINYNFITGTRYNSVQTERSGSAMAVVDQNLDSLDLNDGNTYLQSVTGIYPRINLTPYYRFLENQTNLIVNRADIILKLSPGVTKPSQVGDVENIRFFFAEDGKNIVNNSISVLLTNNSYLSGSLNAAAVGAPNEENTAYETDVTLFAQLVNSGSLDVQKLVVVPLDITSLNQSIFDNSGATLRVYYTVPN